VVKNKVAPPFKVAEFDIMYSEGISKVGGVLDLGVETELISKRGSFYSYGDERLGQGRENAKQYLRDHPDMAEEISVSVRRKFGLLPEEEPALEIMSDNGQEQAENLDLLAEAS
jgi:recombination protein RecA